jgi:hypothetical protein
MQKGARGTWAPLFASYFRFSLVHDAPFAAVQPPTINSHRRAKHFEIPI